MWWITVDALFLLSEYLPLEGKIWLAQVFFGHKYGVILTWLAYQATMERGSLRMITYNDSLDKSLLSSALECIVYTRGLHWVSDAVGNCVGRTLASAVCAASRILHNSGIYGKKATPIPLSGGWAMVDSVVG